MKRKFNPEDFAYTDNNNELVSAFNELKDSDELAEFLNEIGREDLLTTIRTQRAFDKIVSQVDQDLFANEIEQLRLIVERSIPMKPTGKHTQRRCKRCDTRVRSGSGSSSRTRDTICRNCFQVLDWSDE